MTAIVVFRNYSEASGNLSEGCNTQMGVHAQSQRVMFLKHMVAVSNFGVTCQQVTFLIEATCRATH